MNTHHKTAPSFSKSCSIGGWLFGCCVMPIGAVFKEVGHSRCVGWNADICSCWDNSDLTKDTWTLSPRSGVEPSCSYT